MQSLLRQNKKENQEITQQYTTKVKREKQITIKKKYTIDMNIEPSTTISETSSQMTVGDTLSDPFGCDRHNC